MNTPIKLGQLITLEGIDGAGKSSHSATVTQWLKAQGKHVVETREPGGTQLGEQLRDIILHQSMSPMTELLLVFAARAEHVAQVIVPALARGDWVVCDRFTDSTRAYQGGGRDMDSTTIEQLAQLAHPKLQPCLTFIFDVALEQAAARVQGRAGGTETADKFESAPQSFARKVQMAYHNIAQQDSERCVLIDGAQPLEHVRDNVIAELNARLGAYV